MNKQATEEENPRRHLLRLMYWSPWLIGSAVSNPLPFCSIHERLSYLLLVCSTHLLGARYLTGTESPWHEVVVELELNSPSLDFWVRILSIAP